MANVTLKKVGIHRVGIAVINVIIFPLIVETTVLADVIETGKMIESMYYYQIIILIYC